MPKPQVRRSYHRTPYGVASSWYAATPEGRAPSNGWPSGLLCAAAAAPGPAAAMEEANMTAWVSATYACERCSNRYTTLTYGQPNRVLGEGTIAERNPPQLTTAAHCTVDGGRFLLVEEPGEVEP